MRMYRIALFLFVAVVTGLAWHAAPAWSQAAAPPQDPTPFVRPKPLVVVESSDPRALLVQINKIVQSDGFTIRTLNPTDSQLEAFRDDKTERGARDEVIIWLERDMGQPASAIKVFLLYGRFMSILGATSGFRRIRADEAMENMKIGPLRNQLVRLAS